MNLFSSFWVFMVNFFNVNFINCMWEIFNFDGTFGFGVGILLCYGWGVGLIVEFNKYVFGV